MLTKTVTYPNGIADAAALTPTAGKSLRLFRIIASNVDGTNMTLSKGSATADTTIIDLEGSKGFTLEWTLRKPLKLAVDQTVVFTGGDAGVNTILTFYYDEA